MPQLPVLTCPACRQPMAGIAHVDKPPVARKFDDCLRRCEPCRVGASNAADPGAVTYIHENPLGNIPIDSHRGAREALSGAFNVRNRDSKRHRFGFDTSEDAVTWVVFTYLMRCGDLPRP